MRAIQISRTGGPDVLELVDLPLEDPAAGQVRVRHEAIGLNFIETYHRSGLYPLPLPTILGGEAAGLIEAVGAGVTSVREGDRVGFLGARAYAEASIQPADRILRLPDTIDARTAAAAMLKGMTAEMLVRRVHPLKAGETALIHAAAGGVGSILVQWAKAVGAVVIATAGGPDKLERVRAAGADYLIDYRVESVAERVREMTRGVGVDVVYDGVGAATFEDSLASLRRRGLMVTYGNASGAVPAFAPLRLSRGGSLFLTRPTLFDYIASRAEIEESAGALFERIVDGDVTINVGLEFSLEQAADAHRALEARQTLGSTLLIP